MIPMQAPLPDPLVEALFRDVLKPPPGYHYHAPFDSGQILFPVFGSGQWRLLLCKDGTQDVTPLFLEGSFIVTLAKALNATQRELNDAVSNEIPEPVRRVQ